MAPPTVDSTAPATVALAAKYTGAGFPCEIEAGERCIVIYAASLATCYAIARDMLGAIHRRDPDAFIEGVPLEDKDEPAATAWWVSIRLKWAKF